MFFSFSSIFIFKTDVSVIYLDFVRTVLSLLIKIKVSLDFREILLKGQHQRSRDHRSRFRFQGRKER